MFFKLNLFNNFLFCFFIFANSISYLVFCIVFESQISINKFKNKFTSFKFSLCIKIRFSNLFFIFMKIYSKFSLTKNIGSFNSNFSFNVLDKDSSFFCSSFLSFKFLSLFSSFFTIINSCSVIPILF